ncbi:hypothetical protein AKAW_11433, partial [Aspergillus luchuensis IFO 4308]
QTLGQPSKTWATPKYGDREPGGSKRDNSSDKTTDLALVYSPLALADAHWRSLVNLLLYTQNAQSFGRLLAAHQNLDPRSGFDRGAA